VTDDPFVSAEASAAQLTARIGRQHDIAVVLGSGWTPAADALGTPEAEPGPGGEEDDGSEPAA